MRQLYTVEKANRTLPYVKVVVAEVRERYEALRAKGEHHNDLPEASVQDRKLLKEEIKDNARWLGECQEELQKIGIILKDYEMGLADFPAELDGRPILLCWQHGEPEVGFWHEVADGYIGRRPVPEGEPDWPAVSAAAAARE